MPEVSPRRSSRARAVQLPSNQPSRKNSSPSSSSSRADRPARISGGNEPSVRSSSENSDEHETETRRTRRQKREQEQASDPKDTLQTDNANDDDGDEDVTRCICGKKEYPGPPPALGISDPDTGGMFIQCDSCHVWQHGGCVGIMSDDETPDDYFCEQCRPSFHKVLNGSRTQKYSRYLPVVEARAMSPPRKRTAAKESEGRSLKETDSKNAGLHANGKRRSTMNSRAAYDEDEMLRRALEESKGGATESSTSGPRKTKRARDESDDGKSEHDLKRRKTGSESPPQSSAVPADAESDEDASRSRSNRNNGAKTRPSRVQQDQERDFRRREKEREQERQAAASRRKGRADRRHADESETMAEPPRPLVAAKAPSTTQVKSTKPQTNARPQNLSPPRPPSNSHKKGARPARRGKIGRNQYTRERDAAVDARAEAARALQSRDGDDGSGGDLSNQLLSNGSKPARPKHMNPNRTSMNELRKRAAGILEYISRTQVEMAGGRTHSGSQTPAKGPSRPPLRSMISNNGASSLSNAIGKGPNEHATSSQGDTYTVEAKVEMEAFKQMGTLQMMDVLTREIVHWQQQHGKWGEK